MNKVFSFDIQDVTVQLHQAAAVVVAAASVTSAAAAASAAAAYHKKSQAICKRPPFLQNSANASWFKPMVLFTTSCEQPLVQNRKVQGEMVGIFSAHVLGMTPTIFDVSNCDCYTAA